MNSQAEKKNRFADRVRAVEDFEPEPEPASASTIQVEQAADPSTGQSMIGTKNKTIELRLDTISTLKNAVNWQKIIGDGPQSEKDIIETALRVWFKERGYPRQA